MPSVTTSGTIPGSDTSAPRNTGQYIVFDPKYGFGSPYFVFNESLTELPKKYTTTELISEVRKIYNSKARATRLKKVIEFINGVVSHLKENHRYKTKEVEKWIIFFNKGCSTVDGKVALCSDTDKAHQLLTMVRTIDGRTICQESREANYFQCSHCSNLEKNNRQALVMDRTPSNLYAAMYCQACAEHLRETEQLFACRHREGYWFHNNCENCRHDRLREEQSIVKNYSTDVLRSFPSMKRFRSVDGEHKMSVGQVENVVKEIIPLFMGVELEVIPKSVPDLDMAGITTLTHNMVKDFCILKADSSLELGGFEIVSLPCSLDYHKKAWKAFFKNAAQYLKSFKTTCCGLHVHISRKWLTDMQQGKFIVFYNDRQNAGFLGHFAGRPLDEDQRYYHRKDKKVNSGIKVLKGLDKSGKEISVKKEQWDTDHHSATPISSRNHGESIEVRIFKGNVAHFGFMRVLEFVDATCHFVKDTAATKLKYTDFIEWMDGRNVRESKGHNKRSIYPNLTKWLVKEKYLEGAAEKKIDKTKLSSTNLERISPEKLDPSKLVEAA